MNTHKGESVILRHIVRPLLIGLLIGTAVCLIVLLLLAASASAFDIPPAAVIPLATVATAIGAFVGGFTAAKLAKRNGWLMGILTAFMLFLMSMIAGIGLFSQMDGRFVLIKSAIMLACGMIGGMFAVNSGKRKKR